MPKYHSGIPKTDDEDDGQESQSSHCPPQVNKHKQILLSDDEEQEDLFDATETHEYDLDPFSDEDDENTMLLTHTVQADIHIDDTFTSECIVLPKPRAPHLQAPTPHSQPFQPIENVQRASSHTRSLSRGPSASINHSLGHPVSSHSPLLPTQPWECTSASHPMSTQPQVASSGSPLKLNPQAVRIHTSGSDPLTTSLFGLLSSPEPTSTSSDDPWPHKAQKWNIGNITSCRTKKPIAGDFVDEVESTILLAARYYHVLLCTGHAFPLELDSNLYAKQAWQLACQEHENHTLATPDVYKVISLLDSQKHTRYVAHTLPSFVSVPAKSRDHETCMGLFETPILLAAIKTQWFSHAHTEGVNFHMYFNLIPSPAMALVFSMISPFSPHLAHSPWLIQIENCLDEWKSGHFKPIPFQEKCYREIFEEHLATLDKWQNHLQGGSILAQLQTHLHNKAWYR
ncbi:hypothetical protein K439DRAFT_1623097 [Ramaria rubella]|nr:hypothetical protein K439DRAFT_1623097 [Ramaria rubella]